MTKELLRGLPEVTREGSEVNVVLLSAREGHTLAPDGVSVTAADEASCVLRDVTCDSWVILDAVKDGVTVGKDEASEATEGGRDGKDDKIVVSEERLYERSTKVERAGEVVAEKGKVVAEECTLPCVTVGDCVTLVFSDDVIETDLKTFVVVRVALEAMAGFVESDETSLELNTELMRDSDSVGVVVVVVTLVTALVSESVLDGVAFTVLSIFVLLVNIAVTVVNILVRFTEKLDVASIDVELAAAVESVPATLAAVVCVGIIMDVFDATEISAVVLDTDPELRKISVVVAVLKDCVDVLVGTSTAEVLTATVLRTWVRVSVVIVPCVSSDEDKVVSTDLVETRVVVRLDEFAKNDAREVVLSTGTVVRVIALCVSVLIAAPVRLEIVLEETDLVETRVVGRLDEFAKNDAREVVLSTGTVVRVIALCVSVLITAPVRLEINLEETVLFAIRVCVNLVNTREEETLRIEVSKDVPLASVEVLCTAPVSSVVVLLVSAEKLVVEVRRTTTEVPAVELIGGNDVSEAVVEVKLTEGDGSLVKIADEELD